MSEFLLEIEGRDRFREEKMRAVEAGRFRKIANEEWSFAEGAKEGN